MSGISDRTVYYWFYNLKCHNELLLRFALIMQRLIILQLNFTFFFFQRMVEDRNCIGRRVDCEGHIGTVKYIGTVGNTQGQWLGIDWDDPTRGKHNGTYEGIKYYETW